MKFTKSWAAAAAMVALTGTAQAALVSLGDGTVKDTNTNLIWLQDWNVIGLNIWNEQKNWADNLTFAGNSDWALPSIGEYAALVGAYGNLTQVAEFTKLQSSFYWSGTESPSGPGYRWSFRPNDGGQVSATTDFRYYAVAVRPGDVATFVPEPSALALALLALGATVVARRRRPS